MVIFILCILSSNRVEEGGLLEAFRSTNIGAFPDQRLIAQESGIIVFIVT